jgi:4-hydroxybenzoate polyprenyltransferase
MRPKQWTKNLVVFGGLVFAQKLLEPPYLLKALAAFALFCLLSGAVYLLNDIMDVERDRLHPLKRLRPLASGRLSLPLAGSACAILMAISLLLSWFLQPAFFFAALSYLLLQFFYTLWLKNVVILDVFCISAGFVIRTVAGALVIGVAISNWLIICAVLLALFLGLSKRRHELVVLENNAASHRSILAEYSPYLLDQMMAVVTASTVMSYCLYTMWPETVAKFGPHLPLTVPPVLFGIFRYLYLVHQKEGGGAPERVLLSDIPLLLSVLLWGLGVFLIVYLFHH